MRIKEAAEQTGLSISNIRFYEKKGLLAPEREKESKYRDYSREDVERLKRILLYRKMDLSIEVIQLLLEQKVSLEQVLKEQMDSLNEKKEMIQGSIDLCQALLEKQGADTFDVEYYLNYVKEEEKKGRKFAEIEELLTEFASFSRFDVLAGDRMWVWIFQTPGRVRAARMIWSCVLILIPVITVIDLVVNNRGVSSVKLLIFIVFWVAYVRAVGGSFAHFRKNRKDIKDENI